MFRLAQPLWLAALVVPLGWRLAAAWLEKIRQDRLLVFAQAGMARRLEAGNWPWLRQAGSWLLQTALVLLILAAARPQFAASRAETAGRGLDILLLADVSRSMDAADIQPSRLARLRRAGIYLAENLGGNRLGLISFAGTAFFNCPPTQDTGVLQMLLEHLSGSYLPVAGTDFSNALELAFRHWESNPVRHKALVVASDGEDFGRLPMSSIRKAAAAGMKIFCLGIGTASGASVLRPDGKPEMSAGKPVLTRLQERALKQLALLGHGQYFLLTATRQEEVSLLRELNRLEKSQVFSPQVQAWGELYPWLSLAAVVCLLLEWLLGQRGVPGWRAIFSRRGFFAWLAWACLVAPGQGWAGSWSWMQQGLAEFREKHWDEAARCFEKARAEDPDNRLAEYNWGCALLRQHKYIEAYQAFGRAKSLARGTLQKDAWFNYGYAGFYTGLKQGDARQWAEAADAFKQVLLMDPRDEEARYNLELVLRELKKHTRQTSPQEQQSQGQNRGPKEGGGASQAGPDRQRRPGRENPNAQPQESENQTQQRNNRKGKAGTSDQQQGHKQKGMSPEDALRTLRSLESEENTLPDTSDSHSRQESQYRGPSW